MFGFNGEFKNLRDKLLKVEEQCRGQILSVSEGISRKYSQQIDPRNGCEASMSLHFDKVKKTEVRHVW